MPEISVVMGVYNQLNRDVLVKAVRSILDQTFSDFEFIIFDDGSNPEAAALLEEVKMWDPRIVLIGHEENQGLAFSLNTCIEVAKGKYIARMDADDISYPNRLKKQKEFLEAHREYDWVGCNIELFDENGIWGTRVMPEIPTEQDYLRFSPFAHPTVMYRSTVFHVSQGYSSTKEMLRCEDYEYFMRLHRTGLKGANMQATLFCYRESMDSYQKRTFMHRWNETKCRYHNFKALGILFPMGWIYVFRPLFACMIPTKLLAWYKRRESAMQTKREPKEGVLYEKAKDFNIAGINNVSTINRVHFNE